MPARSLSDAGVLHTERGLPVRAQAM